MTPSVETGCASCAPNGLHQVGQPPIAFLADGFDLFFGRGQVVLSALFNWFVFLDTNWHRGGQFFFDVGFVELGFMVLDIAKRGAGIEVCQALLNSVRSFSRRSARPLLLNLAGARSGYETSDRSAAMALLAAPRIGPVRQPCEGEMLALMAENTPVLHPYIGRLKALERF